MGFMDFVNGAVDAAKDAASTAYEDKKADIRQRNELAEQKQAVADGRKGAFRPVKVIGDIEVDDVHRLFKVRRATGDIKKRSGLLSKTGRATAAMMTLGASEAVIAARKPSDKIFAFDELEGYELLEDDSAVTSGGKAAAVAGAALIGGLGAIAGAGAGTKKQKKRIENMVLRIDTNDMEYPCVMVTYINRETKVGSNDYRKAQSQAQQAMSALNLILKQQHGQDVSESVDASDDMEQLKRLKELRDAGVLTEEEFQAKKAQVLGL